MNERSGIKQPESLAEIIEFGVHAIIGTKWTASPAEVLSYDGATKRLSARIIPLRLHQDGSLIEYPVISNVPVLFSGGGGYSLIAPLAAGDTVLLVFCRRGISEFKESFDTDSFDSGGIMEVDAAVAIPCFGGLNVTPSDGLSLQKEDGSVKVEVLSSDIKLTTENGTLELKGNGDVVHGSGAKITAAGDFVTASGVSLDGHIHGGVTSGGSSTAAPTV